MNNRVDVIIEGYAKVSEAGWEASGTTTLILSSNGIKILVDPGANKELLLQKLKEKGLTVEDIDYIFLTHLHLDHSLLMGIFPKAKIINHEAITNGDKGELVGETIPDTDIKIIKTPGHEYAHAILVVPTDKGVVVVAGDNFWWDEGEEQIIDVNRKDDFATNMDELKESRKKVLELADWIIPGHGKIFANKK